MIFDPTSLVCETDLVTLTCGETTIAIGQSGGDDKATVIYIDTQYEPDGSDGGTGLRIFLNDNDTFIGVPYQDKEEAVCQYCLAEIHTDAMGIWIDETGGDGCDQSQIGIHSPVE